MLSRLLIKELHEMCRNGAFVGVALVSVVGGTLIAGIGVREVSREAHEVAGMQRQTRFEIEREADVYGVGGLRFRQVQVWRIPNKLSALVRSADHAVDDVYYVSALRFRESARAMKRDLLRSYQGGQYMGVAQITLLVTTLMAIVLGTVSTVTERINGTLPLLLSFSLGGRTVACAKTLAVGIACGSCSLATIVATGAWASLWLGGLGVEGSAVLLLVAVGAVFLNLTFAGIGVGLGWFFKEMTSATAASILAWAFSIVVLPPFAYQVGAGAHQSTDLYADSWREGRSIIVEEDARSEREMEEFQRKHRGEPLTMEFMDERNEIIRDAARRAAARQGTLQRHGRVHRERQIALGVNVAATSPGGAFLGLAMILADIGPGAQSSFDQDLARFRSDWETSLLRQARPVAADGGSIRYGEVDLDGLPAFRQHDTPLVERLIEAGPYFGVLLAWCGLAAAFAAFCGDRDYLS